MLSSSHTNFRMEKFDEHQNLRLLRPVFPADPRVKNHTYCSAPDCQKERRKQWRQTKMMTDPDYRDNKSRIQRDWLDRNPKKRLSFRRPLKTMKVDHMHQHHADGHARNQADDPAAGKRCHCLAGHQVQAVDDRKAAVNDVQRHLALGAG